MDMIAAYAASKAWGLRPNIVLVEGTTDEALFRRADSLLRDAGLSLLGNDLCIIAAGVQDRGGTFGVARELITLRSMAPFVLNRNGRLAYQVIGLVDNDNAGRRIISDVLRLDRSATEFRDIIALRPINPVFVRSNPSDRHQESDLANLPYRGLDWEIEDTLSPDFMARFERQHAAHILARRVIGEKTHYELTALGKAALHRMVQLEATLHDLSAVVEIMRMVRSMFGLTDLGA